MRNINILNTSQLSSLGLSQTSKGVLLKWNTSDKYYKSGELKYGTFSNLQPVIECICTDIRNKLGIKGANYSLQIINTDGSDEFDKQEILCCVSDNFLKDDETLITFAKHYRNYNDKITYERIINDFKEYEEEINQMIVFDFIVNNVDRHFNNFGYISNGNRKFCPIFDNGLSLYSDLGVDDIRTINRNKYASKKFDRSKPFKNKHISQIKLINKLPEINLNNSNNDFIDIIRKYENYLGKERMEAMISLVEERLDYVRKIYSDV